MVRRMGRQTIVVLAEEVFPSDWRDRALEAATTIPWSDLSRPGELCRQARDQRPT